MVLYKVTTPGLAINTYLVFDPQTKKGAVIDPIRDVNPILQLIEKEGLHITAILETHVHADFVSGSKELKYRLGNEPAIFCSGLGGEEWTAVYADFIAENKQNIILGNVKLQAWHTPGHTPEHLMWVIFDEKSKNSPWGALTGDFLFVGSVGRPDLLGEKKVQILAEQLYDSVFKILPELPDSVEIYPAHGAGSFCGKGISKESSSTLGQERNNNPYLQERPKEAWIQNLLKYIPKAPSYFPLMKEINVIGAPLLSELDPIQELDLQHLLNMQKENSVVVDTRTKEDFASSHIKGALNLEVSGLLPWAPELIPYDKSIIVIAKDVNALDQAIMKMRLVGLDNQMGYMLWTEDLHIDKKFLESYPLLTPEEVSEKIGKGFSVLDVRSQHEWDDGHIPGAIHADLRHLRENLSKIPKNKEGIVCTCARGSRASAAASILQQEGYARVYNMQGGMTEWIKQQRELER